MNLPENCWLPLENETTRAYQHFCVYRDLGPQRSIRKAYIHQLPAWRYTKHGRKRYSRLLPGRWVFWSRINHWHQRALAFDRYLGVERIPVPMLRMYHHYLFETPISRKNTKVISLD